MLRVLERGVLAGSNAPEAAELEQEWAERLGVRHCLATATGTAALHCCAVALGLEPGDEVIVPAFSFVASAFGFAHHGAAPVFCDVDPDTYTLDPNRIAELVNDRTRAIVAVHIHGLPCDMAEIAAVAKRFGLAVVEDAAQAHGARYRGREVGSVGDAAAFSLNATKNLCGGEGGLFVTDDSDAWEAARRLCVFGELSPPRGEDEFRSYRALGLGWNYRLPELSAALARSQLRRLDDCVDRAQHVASVLTAGLRELPGIVPPTTPPDRTHVFHKYRIRLDAKALGFDGPPSELRDRLLWALRAEGVEAVVWQLDPLPALPAFRHGDLVPWSSWHDDAHLEEWHAEAFPEASRLLDESLVLGSERFPLFNQDEAVATLYVEAFERILARLDAVLARPHRPIRVR